MGIAAPFAAADQPAIRFAGVHKRYRMGGDLREKLADALGLSRWLKLAPRERTEFDALHDISFEVPRGRRYGLIGRNGAGKTTLLKLISGNFAPTSGQVEVNGSIQALMTMGHGFHPEYSGRDNLMSSLQYNGLNRTQFREAVEDVIDFCELGLFIDQPFKTYSSGMQARLMFATATAVKPDILVVDEVLGAGDAYFIAKSRVRVDRLVGNGCTLLLVSHSMSQVLELCEHVVWLDAGRIRQIGPAFEVVKAYEEWMHGSIDRLDKVIEARTLSEAPPIAPVIEDSKVVDRNPDARNARSDRLRAITKERSLHLQIPNFLPHASPASLPEISDDMSRTMAASAPGGISRWAGRHGLQIVGVSILGPAGPSNHLVSLQPAAFVIFLEVTQPGQYDCTYGIAVHDLQGRAVTRIFSPPDRFSGSRGAGRRLEIVLNPNQIGPGAYTLGVSIHAEATIEQLATVSRYDLLSRSFLFHVDVPDTWDSLRADFFHSAEWTTSSCEIHPLTELSA